MWPGGTCELGPHHPEHTLAERTLGAGARGVGTPEGQCEAFGHCKETS